MSSGSRLGDAVDELEELRRTQDRVGHRQFPDQLFLRHLGAEVAALRNPVGADHRQRDVMPRRPRPPRRPSGCGPTSRRTPGPPCPRTTASWRRRPRYRAPSSASASPSPVTALTPELGDAAFTSWPSARSLPTSLVPMSPLPPMTTIFLADCCLSMGTLPFEFRRDHRGRCAEEDACPPTGRLCGGLQPPWICLGYLSKSSGDPGNIRAAARSAINNSHVINSLMSRRIA